MEEAATVLDSLTVAAVDGDREALSELLCRHDAALRRRLDGRIARKFQASISLDDLIQVTYIEAFLAIDRFRPGKDGAFLAWLTSIAENNIRDAVKSFECDRRPPPSKRVGNTIGDDSYICLFATLAGTQTTPSVAANRKETKDLLEAALVRLPPDYEQVVRLCDLEGHTAPEVAILLNRSVGAVHMLKARAHERLAILLGGSSKFFGVSA